MHILFPSNPDARREPDPVYQPEREALDALGLSWRLFSYESLQEGDLGRAFKQLPPGQGETLLYRGWMFKEAEHRRLSEELAARGYRLFTDTAAYARTHYLPNWYERLRDLTPPAVWTEAPDAELAWRLAQAMGPPPYIVKDHVKSAKQSWFKACYAPPECTREQFLSICKNLHDFQADRFERGFVVRPFVQLQFLETSRWGFPIFEEYRLLFFEGELLTASAYDRVGGAVTDFSAFRELARRIDSPFFSADVARAVDGRLILIELGDGGVSQLPPSLDIRAFYERLQSRLRASP